MLLKDRIGAILESAGLEQIDDFFSVDASGFVNFSGVLRIRLDELEKVFDGELSEREIQEKFHKIVMDNLDLASLRGYDQGHHQE